MNISGLLALACLFLCIGCKNKRTDNPERKVSVLLDSIESLKDTSAYTFASEHKDKTVKIYGDTVWVRSYATTIWYDSIEIENIGIYLSAWVDTTDFIIDTVISSKGNRIAIGYNHHYNIRCNKDGHFWFSLAFDKKRDLKELLEETDFWLESNIDVFHTVFYNKKYDKFIIDYNINPRYNYGAVYYFVFNTDGTIEYTGIAGNWGGGEPDGEPFLTGNNEMFVTANELYCFKNRKNTEVSALQFFKNSVVKKRIHSQLTDIHAYKPLTDSTFLMIFNRNDLTPEYNAFIIGTDTTVLGQFKYYGMIEEMEAMLLFEYNDRLNTYFLYDTERKSLISISDSGLFSLKEHYLKDMNRIQSDTLPDRSGLEEINFEAFGTYKFFIEPNVSTIYFDIDMFE
ncbi:MAG: hypothetical protein JXB24_15315 [Bacteroidales bacterium]|nr:hypothetical protein [Bacteroidales bacterium]